MNNNKLYVIGGDTGYANWMLPVGLQLCSKLSDAGMVLFTGGSDVNPTCYGRKKHPYTGINAQRDIFEEAIFNDCINNGKKMIGTCRGSQFLCAMAGGLLVQHQDNPAFMHLIKTYDGNEIIVSSTHHQAQYPWNLPSDEYKVLGWSEDISPFHEDWDRSEMVYGHVEGNKECEIVYYSKIQAFGCQSHPEMIYDERFRDKEVAKSIEYCQGLLSSFLNGEL